MRSVLGLLKLEFLWDIHEEIFHTSGNINQFICLLLSIYQSAYVSMYLSIWFQILCNKHQNSDIPCGHLPTLGNHFGFHPYFVLIH